MGSIGVGKAWLQSYHHMCRWNAGLFALEKRLAYYDFFWRVEPGVSLPNNTTAWPRTDIGFAGRLQLQY
jgi:hypothetical protein